MRHIDEVRDTFDAYPLYQFRRQPLPLDVLVPRLERELQVEDEGALALEGGDEADKQRLDLLGEALRGVRHEEQPVAHRSAIVR